MKTLASMVLLVVFAGFLEEHLAGTVCLQHRSFPAGCRSCRISFCGCGIAVEGTATLLATACACMDRLRCADLVLAELPCLTMPGRQHVPVGLPKQKFLSAARAYTLQGCCLQQNSPASHVCGVQEWHAGPQQRPWGAWGVHMNLSSQGGSAHHVGHSCIRLDGGMESIGQGGNGLDCGGLLVVLAALVTWCCAGPLACHVSALGICSCMYACQYVNSKRCPACAHT